MRKTILAFVAAGVVLPTRALSQDPKDPQGAPTELSRALMAVRDGHLLLAAAILAQERTPLPTDELDALADSLVAIAIAFGPGDDLSTERAAVAAEAALVVSTHPGRGIPYPHAFEKLQRVYEESPDRGARGGTLMLFTQLPKKGRVVGFLVDIATGKDTDVAVQAVQILADELGEPGVSRLWQLFVDGAVQDPAANERLVAIARRRGW